MLRVSHVLNISNVYIENIYMCIEDVYMYIYRIYIGCVFFLYIHLLVHSLARESVCAHRMCSTFTAQNIYVCTEDVYSFYTYIGLPRKKKIFFFLGRPMYIGSTCIESSEKIIQNSYTYTCTHTQRHIQMIYIYVYHIQMICIYVIYIYVYHIQMIYIYVIYIYVYKGYTFSVFIYFFYIYALLFIQSSGQAI